MQTNNIQSPIVHVLLEKQFNFIEILHYALVQSIIIEPIIFFILHAWLGWAFVRTFIHTHRCSYPEVFAISQSIRIEDQGFDSVRGLIRFCTSASSHLHHANRRALKLRTSNKTHTIHRHTLIHIKDWRTTPRNYMNCFNGYYSDIGACFV